MGLFSIWASFGLTENPYSHATLAGDDVGDRLLAGRDRETAVLHMALGSGGSHPTVEGPVGSGKSSLISVSTYRMTQRCLEAKARQLYVATPKFFQVTADLQSFETDVYLGACGPRGPKTSQVDEAAPRRWTRADRRARTRRHTATKTGQ